MSEVYHWQAVDRTTETVYDEDIRGLGSWGQLNAYNIKRISLVRLLPPSASNGDILQEMHIDYEVPEGAAAVFTRRRILTLELGRHAYGQLPTWTIIGHRWPDGTGHYCFFAADGETYVESDDFDAV